MMDRVLNNNHTNNTGTAPFVMKIYQLVSDPSTDHIVAWGSGNNSFIIMDAMHFSQRILPAYFKHNNFSSFVRQLNTYGFRKVDPEQWEFANQWFLRGQDHLLHNITRKKHSRNVTYKREHDMDENELRKEVSRLKEEQRLLEEELRQMNQRIEAAERRPEQMMTLLYKAIEDPQVLIPLTMLETGYYKNRSLSGEKKRRILVSSGSSSSSSCSYNSSSMAAVSSSGKGEEEEVATDVVVGCHSPPPRPVPYPFCLLEGSF